MAIPPPSDAESTSPPSHDRLRETIGNAFARIAPDLERVEGALRDTLDSKAALIPILGEHLLSSGGKRRLMSKINFSPVRICPISSCSSRAKLRRSAS